MEFNLDKHTTRRKSSSESLQRAIERNRSKRAKRQGNEPHVASGPPSRPRPLGAAQASKSRSIASSPDESIFEHEIRTPRKKLPADITYSKNDIKKPISRKGPLKKSLNANITPIRKRAVAPIQAPEKKGFKAKVVDMLVYAGWIACLILLVRLIISERGVWDYYSRLRNFDELRNQFSQMQDSNQGLVEEIQLIGSSRSYQKKLIRDNLGFISSAEYLLLFSNKRKPTSI